jgi:DNA-binding winged helix-turn-helix (wHTH) protein/pimeloyl-ACP methyl ester carboxylesterase
VGERAGDVIYHFEGFALDVDRFELRRDGELLALEPQVFSVLSYLVRHADRVVPRDELLEAVWETTYVSDAALGSRVMSARKILGDDGRNQRFIRTIPRRGFRFVAAITTQTGEASASPTAEPAGPPDLVRNVRSADGTRIAFAERGSGATVMVVPDVLPSSGSIVGRAPLGGFMARLARGLSDSHRVVTFDTRGTGMSDRNIADASLDALTDDLLAVKAATEDGPVPLIANWSSTPLAVAAAAASPGDVSCLVLTSGYARAADVSGYDPVRAMAREDWSTFTDFVAGRTAAAWRADSSELVAAMRDSTTQANYLLLSDAAAAVDVTELLPQIACPTLTIEFTSWPYTSPLALSSGIPGARHWAAPPLTPEVLPEVVRTIEGFVREVTGD